MIGRQFEISESVGEDDGEDTIEVNLRDRRGEDCGEDDREVNKDQRG